VGEDIRLSGLNTEETSDAALWIRRITGKETVHKVSYGTEAGLFHNAGIPSVVCGPGSIEQAHRSDEYIAVDQLSACDSFLRDVLRDACERA
jgi:acetylornithine deacetylase